MLIVDDEPALVDVVKYNLEQAGFGTVVAGDGREALRLAAEARPDLVVLDLMLPGLDGLTVCRRLREIAPDLPVIILTARDGELERVLGLETGADDYVTKPFSPREFVARVRAVLRRAEARPLERVPPEQLGRDPGKVAGQPGPAPRTLELGLDLVLDRAAREVLRQGQPAGLTPTELRLLETLAERRGDTLSRRELFALAWGPEAYGDERTVDVHIRHIREKLEADPSHPELIVTIRGFGYRLRALPNRAAATGEGNSCPEGGDTG